MCGIIGYVGKKKASFILLNSLKKLEYRGYDSCGIATLFNGKIHLKKDVGSIEKVNKKLDFKKMKGKVGIAHTRWATHGKVTKNNAHPHLSNNKRVAVVHNGIIENYQELKNFLMKKGFKFYSETDTEVIPNLIEYYMKGKNFVNACKSAFEKLEGSYAIVAICEDSDKVVAIRKESPLVVGIGKDEYFIASDILAFLNHTNKVIYLVENDMVILDEKLRIFNLKTKKFVKRPIDSVEWSIEEVKKGKFEHFMLKEITEQAKAISRAIEQDEKIIKKVARLIKKAKGIYLVGCGSSYHACLSASYKFSKIAKMHVNVALASEFHNYKDFLIPQSLVIAVSQSGETADVLDAVRAAKEKGSKVISIVNVVGSSLKRESDYSLLMKSGPEICVLSTKTYTSQLAILTLLAYAVAGKYKEGKRKLKDLINYIYYLTSANTRKYIKKLAKKLKKSEHIYLIGRGLQYPTALEAALKIKEVSYIHAEGFAGGELKHGNIALIEKNTPCIVFTSKETEKEILSNASELKARGGYIIGIGPKNNELFDFYIKVREAQEANSICQIIPIQILAYQLAILKGNNPDFPKNLAKSVTVK